jgi:hypothetical protein
MRAIQAGKASLEGFCYRGVDVHLTSLLQRLDEARTNLKIRPRSP